MDESVITGLISALGSSSIVGAIFKFLISKAVDDLKTLNSSVKLVTDKLQSLETRMAVHEVVVSESKVHRDEVVLLRKDITIIQGQMNAVWRILDARNK